MIGKVVYYPKKIMEQVRAANDIAAVISEFVPIQEMTHGDTRDIVAQCPFDDKKEFSLLVSPSKQVYQCVECGASGDVFSFIMESKKVSLTEAIEYLAQRAKIQLPPPRISTLGQDELETTLAINREAALFYRHNLISKSDPAGLEYLHSRGLTDDTIKRFGLGYARTRSDDLYQHLTSKGFTKEQMEKAGLISFYHGVGYDKFRGRAMCPIIDTEKRVLGFSGRIIGDGEPKYKNSPGTLLFDKKTVLYGLHIAQHSQEDSFILCEGNFDVISLNQAGFRNTVAPLGTAFTKEHCRILSQYTEKVHLVYDSDAPGVKATLRVIPMLQEAGIHSDVVSLEPYKDPDEFLKAEGAEAFRKRLLEAESSLSFELRHRFGQYDVTNPEEKQKMLECFAQELLSKPVSMQDNYIDAMNHYIENFENNRVGRESLCEGQVEKASDEDLSSFSANTSAEGAIEQIGNAVVVDTSWMEEYDWFSNR